MRLWAHLARIGGAACLLLSLAGWFLDVPTPSATFQYAIAALVFGLIADSFEGRP